MASTTEPTTMKEDESMLEAEDEDTTGEENEEVTLDLKAMNLFKLDVETLKWIEKESGPGAVKLLKDKEETRIVRLVVRHNKTRNLYASHYVSLRTLVKEHPEDDKRCMWHTGKFADGKPKVDEAYSIRFASAEDCKSFRDKIQEIKVSLCKDSGQRKKWCTPAARLSLPEPTTLKEDESMLPDEDVNTTGEVLLDLKVINLFWLDTETIHHIYKEVESGPGAVKLLKNKETKKVRLVMRHNKTRKLCADHYVRLTMLVEEHQWDKRCCVWSADDDFADEIVMGKTFCIRFASVEDCKSFRDKIQEIQESLRKDIEQRKRGDTAATALVEQLSIEGDSK